MLNEDLNTEIELLRKQLNALQKERESASVPIPEQNAESRKEGSAAGLDELLSEIDMDKLDLTKQLKDLLDSLDKDIRETKPSTLLIVFALGVLIGRLR